MLIRRPDDIPSSEITSEGVYVNRRQFIGMSAGVALGGAAGGGGLGNFGAAPRHEAVENGFAVAHFGYFFPWPHCARWRSS